MFRGKNIRKPDKDSGDQTPKKKSDVSGGDQLGPQDKALLLKTWGQKDGEMTDFQILRRSKMDSSEASIPSCVVGGSKSCLQG